MYHCNLSQAGFEEGPNVTLGLKMLKIILLEFGQEESLYHWYTWDHGILLELFWEWHSVTMSHFAFCCCSVAQLCLTLCNNMNCSTSGFLVLHHLLEFAQTHVYQVGDAIQPSHPLSSFLLLLSIFPSIRVLSNESGSSHQVAKVLELHLQYQSFQWIFRVDFP